MGAVPSTPRLSCACPQYTAEYLIGSFIGEKTFPIDSLHEACKLFTQNNCYTRYLAKILIHLSWCLQECVSNSAAPSEVYAKAVNAVYISSVFLKYLIENAQSNNSIKDLYFSLNVSEPAPNDFNTDQNIENLVMHSVLNFIGSVEVSYDSVTFVLLPFNYLVSSTGEGSRNPVADCRLHGLLILNYYLKCVVGDESMTDRSSENATADSLSKGKTHFSDFPYCKALENAM